jgi:hypothetical protein
MIMGRRDRWWWRRARKHSDGAADNWSGELDAGTLRRESERAWRRELDEPVTIVAPSDSE